VGSNQDNYQLYWFTTTENIAKFFFGGEGYFLTCTVSVQSGYWKKSREPHMTWK